MYGSPSTRPVVRSRGCDFRFKGSGMSARSKLSSEANDSPMLTLSQLRIIIFNGQMKANTKMRTDFKRCTESDINDLWHVFV